MRLATFLLVICVQLEWLVAKEAGRTSRQSVAEEADQLFADFWREKMEAEPEFASSVGVHTYNDKLNPMSPTDFLKKHAMLVKYVAKAHELLPYADEGTPTRRNLQLFISQNIFQINLLNIGTQYLPVSYLDGPHMNMMFLMDYHPLKTAKDYRDLVARYNAFNQQVDEIISLMNVGISRSLTQHERSLKNLEKTYSDLDKPAEESFFYSPFKSIGSAVPADEIAEIQESARQAIDSSVSPGFRKLRDYIRDVYRGKARPEIAASSLPNGTAFYRTLLNFHATMDVEPADLHQLGLNEVERIKAEMKKVISSLGLELGLREFNDKIRSDPQFFFTSEDEAVDAYRDIIMNQIQPKLSLLFKNIPRAVIQIKKVPEEMAGGPQAYYLPGTPDGTSQGTFYVDTSSLKDLPKYNTMTLSLHEGIPGHHLQVSYSMEQEGIPEFRKYVQVPVNTAFLEGWALYSEYLGYEMGLYSDPYMLYGHLSEEIFRACRLVVDTGIHALGWTRERAIEYMVQNSAATEKTVANEIDRYITWPGQACSYKFGEIKIKQLRKKAEDELGSKFDLKEFHDVVLRSNGPLAIVEQEVNRMIQFMK